MRNNVFFSRELLKVLGNGQVEKPSSEMVTRCEQQVQQQNLMTKSCVCELIAILLVNWLFVDYKQNKYRALKFQIVLLNYCLIFMVR